MTQPNEQLIETIEKALERYCEIKSEPTDLPGMNNQRMIELSFDLKQITREFPEWLRALLTRQGKIIEVLRWYAHPETYEIKGDDESDPAYQTFTDITRDNGDHARSILKEIGVSVYD